PPVPPRFTSGGPEQPVAPAGSPPRKTQPAYGLSTGSAYNNNISFGGIKGDGTGQTIAIFEVGSNPAFVGTSDPNFGTSALAVFDKTFGLPDPPSLTFYDQSGQPITPANPGPGNLFAGSEIALDIEWAHAMAPGASIDVVNANSYSSRDEAQGMATAATLPGVSAVSISYAFLNELFGQGS